MKMVVKLGCVLLMLVAILTIHVCLVIYEVSAVSLVNLDLKSYFSSSLYIRTL